MIKPFYLAALAALSILSFSGAAADDKAELKAKLEADTGLLVESVAPAPVDGLYQIITNRGLFYVSEDGGYLLQARIFSLNEGMKNITEAAISEMRMEGIQQFADSAIEFPADNEKYVISVFTDITCGYCRKLHNEINEFNNEGITVRYLAFPRAGLEGKAYDDMVSVWCAKDSQQALTDAKAGKRIEQVSCDNQVAEQFVFGQKIGVTGTPNIVLPNGQVIGGYQPADVIAEVLSQTE